MNLECIKAHDTAGALSTSENRPGGERAAILPHPSPRPLGEGKAIERQDFSNPLPASSDSSVAQNRTAILPLPAGEGRGE